MKGERHVGGEIRVLSNLIKRCMDDGACRRRPPACKGGSSAFCTATRTVTCSSGTWRLNSTSAAPRPTGILQLMEKNGFLLREPVAYDARLKKLVLTAQGFGGARGRDLPHPRHRGTHHQRRHTRRAGAIFRHHSQIPPQSGVSVRFAFSMPPAQARLFPCLPPAVFLGVYS